MFADIVLDVEARELLLRDPTISEGSFEEFASKSLGESSPLL